MTPRNRVAVSVEADDRTALYPHGNFLSHVMVLGVPATNDDDESEIRLEAVFTFNDQQVDPLITVMGLDDARALSRALLEGVYQGRTQHVLTQSAKIAVIFNPNGFVLRFGEERDGVELFIAAPAIIRLAQGIARVSDRLLAPAPH